MSFKKLYFVSGIDTDAGKSYATGALARMWTEQGVRVVTQKFIQTGSLGLSEDIALHRRLMGIDLLPEDLDNTTCPIRFSYPCSPDLAARIDGRTIDLSLAECSTEKLLQKWDTVLLEGAGGLLVPICGEYTMADYVAQHNLPLILVTNPKLGSVNHTLLSLELCRTRGINVDTVVYNHHPVTSPEITDDTRQVILNYMAKYFAETNFVEIPFIESPE